MPLVKIIILPFALLLLIAGLSLAEPIRIEFGHMGDLNSARGKAGEYFKRSVEQRSNSRIQVSINSESPTDDQHSIEMLRSNKTQLAAPDISEFYALNPQLRLPDLPFFFNDIKQLHNVIDDEVGTELLEIASQGELVALSFWDKGLRQLTLAQLCTATLRGKKIDGQENTLAVIAEQKLYQVQSDLTISDHRYTGFLVVTNKYFWSQLPEDLKLIIKGALKSAAEYTRDIAIQINEEALKKISATNQVKIHRLTREERERSGPKNSRVSILNHIETLGMTWCAKQVSNK